MRKYQWLLFDADGTLFDYDSAEGRALQKVFDSFSLPFGSEHLAAYRRINDSLWQALEAGEVTPEQVKLRRFEMLLKSIPGNHSPKDFSAAYLEYLADCAELIDGAAHIVEKLHARYRLAILTNGLHTVQRKRLASSTISHFIEEMIVSEEIGVAKPAKEFFAVTFAKLGNPPRENALMIGDNWNSDILGATNFGIDACWYNPGAKPRPTNVQIVREIASLHELADWLE
ncbi:MAG TPA: YjjG family noncanonical pyrimidine nucleotidase [Verrucomicrobiae bacterium]|nr:YjjG family noncanonical pyrimidine nucleotidase [Verrucomicrobiae bacterium]